MATIGEALGLRDPTIARRVVEKIKGLAKDVGPAKFVHVCGTHEWTITHYGLRSLLPDGVELIPGPGCPVCVCPSRDIDEAIQLALDGVVVATFGDMVRVPSTRMSLADAKAEGGDVRVVYSVSDAVEMARREPGRDFAFFAIGFETTAPTNAVEILRKPPENFSLLVSHRLIPPVMELLLGIGELHLDGFIVPGHVATITGAKAFKVFPEAYGIPSVIAGFEPLDVLIAVYMLLRQVREGEARLENEYTRSVTWEGNTRAQEAMERVFRVADGSWRGIGVVPKSALELRDEFSVYDARKKYDIKVGESRDVLPGCSCHLVIVGRIKPTECPLFMKKCTPQTPWGPCMVSREGTCHIWATHSRVNAQQS